MKRFACLTFAMMLPMAAWSAGKDTQEPAAPRVISGYVASVYDGDTLQLADGTKVRLLDINTPELDHKGGKSEPYAREAAEKLRQLVDEK
ncbi:MAG: thermonuclease family protein, partial [Alphaproteobacteria bacterium]